MNTTQPWHDSIVAEIHATRERLAEQYQNDLLAYSQAAESHCRALGFQIVESPRRRLVHEKPQQVEVAAHETVPCVGMRLRSPLFANDASTSLICRGR